MIININIIKKDDCDIYLKNKILIKNSSFENAAIFLRKNLSNIKFTRINNSNFNDINIEDLKLFNFIKYELTNYHNGELEILKLINDYSNDFILVKVDKSILIYIVEQREFYLNQEIKFNSYNKKHYNEKNNLGINKLIKGRLDFESSYLSDFHNVEINDIIRGFTIADKLSTFALEYIIRKVKNKISETIEKKNKSKVIVLHSYPHKFDHSLFNEIFSLNYTLVKSRQLNVGNILNKYLEVRS